MKKDGGILKSFIDKIKEWIAAAAFLWISFWAMAVDSPGDSGLIAGGLAMIGAAVLGGILLIEWRAKNGKRL